MIRERNIRAQDVIDNEDLGVDEPYESDDDPDGDEGEDSDLEVELDDEGDAGDDDGV